MPFITSIERLGELRGMRESVKLILESKFQEEGRDLFTGIDAMDDVEVLKRVCRVVGTADSLEKVRAVWSENH